MAVEKKAANAMIVKPNQIGSILETVFAMREARKDGWKLAVSHRSGETEDAFIADLAYASHADFIKTGSMSRSDRLSKYNRLREIEAGL
jgi:enolase